MTKNINTRSVKYTAVMRVNDIISEETLRGYIVQYNNCGLACEGSEDIASEGSENRHF